MRKLKMKKLLLVLLLALPALAQSNHTDNNGVPSISATPAKGAVTLSGDTSTPIPAPEPITQDSVNTQVQTTSNDAQAAAIHASKDFGLVAADLKLLWDMMGQFRLNQLADLDAQITKVLTAHQGQLDQLSGTVTTVQGQVNQQQPQIDAASQQAAQALALAQAIADYPFSNIKVVGGPVGGATGGSVTPVVITFTTLKPMSVWVNGGGLTIPWQSRTGCVITSGTIAPPSPITLSTTFSFLIPASWPPHGCLVFLGRDANGTESDHGVIY